MNNKQIAEKWLSVFAEGVSEDDIQKYVYDCGNYLWHIFSWELVECLKGDEARQAFDGLNYENAIQFYNGYKWENNSPQIEDVSVFGKVWSKDLEGENDVYIVSEDFKWTYVHTHESQCGPYFVSKI